MPKKKKRKQKKILPAEQFIRIVCGELLAVHMRRERPNRKSLVGYRVVRIAKVKWNRHNSCAVKIFARLFGGERNKNRGWNGPSVMLDRDEFTGAGKGIVRGVRLFDVDHFVLGRLGGIYAEEDNVVIPFEEDSDPRTALRPADFIRPDEQLPLAEIMTENRDSRLEAELAAVIASHPEIVIHKGSVQDPLWRIDCPDGATLILAGYGPAHPLMTVSKSAATHMSVVGYSFVDSVGKSRTTMGKEMASSVVHTSIRKLITQYRKTSVMPKKTGSQLEDAIPKNESPMSQPASPYDDEYFA